MRRRRRYAALTISENVIFTDKDCIHINVPSSGVFGTPGNPSDQKRKDCLAPGSRLQGRKALEPLVIPRGILVTSENLLSIICFTI